MTLSVAQASKEIAALKEQSNRFKPYQVTVCGGGNGAHVASGFLASQGIRVNVLTRQPKRWTDSICIDTAGSSWSGRGMITGKLNLVTDDAAEAVANSDVVIVAAPANAHPDILRKVSPYLEDGVALGALFAQGGFDMAATNALGKNINSKIGTLFGLQNIPWICKIKKYGSEARIIGPKRCLYVATYPVEDKCNMALKIESMFDIPCETLPNFLCLTLTPSNQIIHPARYYGIFRDWDGEKSYSVEEVERRNGMTLYDNFDEYSAEVLTAIDNELQQIKGALCKRFPQLDLSHVMPIAKRIVTQYGSDVKDTSSLKSIFCSNVGYKGCSTPMKDVGNGRVMPNVNTRLFWEDIPYGLCILKNMAELLGNFPTPTMDFLIRWHQQFMGVEYLSSDGQLNPLVLEQTGTPYKYGIHNLQDLVKTCLPKSLVGYKHPNSKL